MQQQSDAWDSSPHGHTGSKHVLQQPQPSAVGETPTCHPQRVPLPPRHWEQGPQKTNSQGATTIPWKLPNEDALGRLCNSLCRGHLGEDTTRTVLANGDICLRDR